MGDSVQAKVGAVLNQSAEEWSREAALLLGGNR